MSEPSLPEPLGDAPGERRLFSYVWLVPIATLIILVTVMWRTYGDKGPLVTIAFERGTGIEAGKTPIRHRGIQIGTIESIGLSADTARVVVSARMDKGVSQHLNATTRFWIVRPRVSGSQVSGLDTLLGGTYIGASWDPEVTGGGVRTFDGLDAPPLTPAGTPGRHVTLHATEGAAIAVGAPVYFKNIPVGRIETRRINDDSSGVTYEAFIDAPYDERVSPATRFWNVSGFTVELGAQGASMQVESLLTLLEGGVSFDNLPVPRGALLAGDGREFTLYPGPDEARSSLLEAPPEHEVLLSAVFSGSVRGLRPGAPVEYRGVRVGEVKEIQVDLSPGRDEVAIATVLRIQPLRISREAPQRERVLEDFQARVARGMRAQLASGSLLTGALYVNLVDRPDDPSATLDMQAEPYPRIPSVPSDIAAITSSAQSLMARVDALPLEQVLGALTRVLDDAHVLLASESARALPGHLNAAADGIAALANAEDTRAVPRQLSASLAEIRKLLERLNAIDVPKRAASTLQAAERTAAALEEASAGLPALMLALGEAAANAQALMKGLKPGSEMHYELQRAITEVRRAAQAVGALAVKLEAKPNALILGK